MLSSFWMFCLHRSQETCVSKLFSSDKKAQTMPAMRCNRASLMQTKIQQFSTMETSLTLNIGDHRRTSSHAKHSGLFLSSFVCSFLGGNMHLSYKKKKFLSINILILWKSVILHNHFQGLNFISHILLL